MKAIRQRTANQNRGGIGGSHTSESHRFQLVRRFFTEKTVPTIGGSHTDGPETARRRSKYRQIAGFFRLRRRFGGSHTGRFRQKSGLTAFRAPIEPIFGGSPTEWQGGVNKRTGRLVDKFPAGTGYRPPIHRGIAHAESGGSHTQTRGITHQGPMQDVVIADNNSPFSALNLLNLTH